MRRWETETDPASARGTHPSAPLLEVEDLRVRYRLGNGRSLPAIRGLSLDLRRGEVLGIVGETGSGKSTLAHTLLGLLSTAEVEGTISFHQQPLPVQDEVAMREFRWCRISLVFQTAGTGFDPVYAVGDQIGEAMRVHRGRSREEAGVRSRELWGEVGLQPERFDHYPHQLSGGEKRLAMLAMALACDPELLILDEPTAGMDAFTRTRILALLRELRQRRTLTMIVITHTLADLPGLASRTLILYAGRAAELGPTAKVLSAPRHPYSWGLLNAYPSMTRARDLWGIRGDPPDPAELPAGCSFAPRCTQAVDACGSVVPLLKPHDGRLVACHLGGLQTLLESQGLSKTFKDRHGRSLQAVRNASLRLMEGEVVALVGQTGSGKSTLARLLVGLIRPDSGEVMLEGEALHTLKGSVSAEARRRLQLISQDPYDSLSPRLSILELVREPVDIQGKGSREERDAMARAAISEVRLPTTADFLAKRSHELSGGQLQRVAIARALILRPKVLIADEPVSMLDASEQARLLRLLKDLQNEHGMGLLLISHDIALVRKVADRILVMEKGVIVEEGLADRVINSPRHPHTRLLLAAASEKSDENGKH
jgi:peptide/nickel transport system ATP-binding protein